MSVSSGRNGDSFPRDCAARRNSLPVRLHSAFKSDGRNRSAHEAVIVRAMSDRSSLSGGDRYSGADVSSLLVRVAACIRPVVSAPHQQSQPRSPESPMAISTLAGAAIAYHDTPSPRPERSEVGWIVHEWPHASSRPRAARLAYRARTPKVHGEISVESRTVLTSAPSKGVEMVTRSPRW